MDFNQILLFTSLGLLVLIVLFALWGFLGGLKRELKCIAVFIVLLVLFWLVFGDEATLMNAKFGQQVASILNVQNDSITTIWDAVLAFARANIPNGETLLVEGKETYALFYSVAATIFRAIGLMAGTIVVLIICPIIRLITHIIWLIVRGVKKNRAKKESKATDEQPVVVASEEKEEKIADQVVIASNKTSADEAVITKEENELPVKPKTKKRWWGALAGALKGVFVIILVFAPVSGLCTILNTATPETQAMVSDLINGKQEEKTANTSNMVETVFDFAEAYENSAVGKFVESSSYFFGKSFSQSLFDILLRIETKNQTIGLNDELINVVEAANELNGKTKLGSWTNEEVKKFLEQLKDSKLLVEAMPVAIEYAYEVKDINKYIVEADQGVKFLELRYNNWKKDLPTILNTVAKVYELDIFPLDEFNYLTMNATQLKEIVNELSKADIVHSAFPIAIKVALKLDVVENNVGEINPQDLETIDWKKELNTIVDAYQIFQDLKITTLKDVDFQVLAKEILNDDVRKEVVFDVVDKVLELQLADRLLVPVGIHFASKQQSVKDLLEKANQVDAFMDLQNVITLNDVKALVSAIRKGLILVDITDFPKVAVNYLDLNVGDLRNVVSELNNVSSLNNIIDVALHIALSIDQVKEYVGTSLDGVDFSDIHWASDLMLLTDIYEAFLDFDFETVDDITNSKWNALIASIVEDEIKFDSAQTIVEKLASLDAYIKIGAPTIENVVEKLINEHAKEFANILEITSLTSDEWKEDLLAILDVVKAVNEIKVLEAVDVNPFDYKNLDLTSIQSVENFKKIVDKVLSLHLLGDDELKNKLVLASIRQYGWVDDSDKIDLKDVNWQSEKEVLIHLIDTYSKIVNLEVFDIYDVKNLNWQELLESDAFIDSVVEALDNLVDSNVFLELLPNLIDKYVLPRLENIEQLDDDTLISDILDKVSSEELVQEVIKLIDVVKAAVDLGLFNVNKDGINAVDLANTDALKDIVSGILGSKLIEGNEGRVIRVILKATGILNIEKGSDVYNELISIDYTNEKDILLEFIDKITPVLKDETFKLVDEEGKFKLDLKFWAENENAQTLLEGAKVLFGSYEENTTGSNLITALLPAIYDKFVDDKNLIPDDFITIVDELNVTEADGKTLSHDISCLIYVLEQLVKVNAQSFLDEGSVEINDAFALAINNIIDALHDIELIKNHEKETLAWGVNYIAKLLNIELDAVNTDFENVDWQGQKEVYKEIVNDLVALLVENNITNVNQLKGVFDEIIAGKSKYVTDSSVNELLNILDQVADVQVIDAVLPLAIKFVVKLLDEKGIALDYLNEFTSVELAEDFHKIIEIAHIAVDEGEFVKYYQNGFDEKLALPKEEVVHSIIHEALQLHILADADGRLLSSLYEKFVAPIEINGEPIFLKAEDFDFANIDWSTEEEILHSIVRAFYDLAEVSDFDTIAGLKDLIQNQSFKYKPFFTDEVGYILVDLLRDLEHSQLVKNVIVKAFEYAIDTIENSNKIPFSIVDIKGLTAEDLMSCISPLAEILDIAIEVGVLEYVRTNDIAVIDVDLIADAIEKLGKVDRFTENVTELLHKALQYVANLLNEKLGSNIVISVADVEAIDIESECNILAQAIRSTKGVFEANDLVSLKDIIDFVKGKEYQSEAFINSSLAPVVCNLVDLKIVQLFLPGLLDALVDKVTFVDLSFLKNSFTGEELASDMKQLTNAIDTIKDAELVSVLLGKTKVEELNLHIAEYAEIVEVAKDLYVLNKKYPELASALINKGLNAIQSEQAVTKKLFEGITFADEAPALIEALKQFELVANQAKFVTVQDIIDVTKDKKFYENEAYVNENVVYPLIDTLEELTNLQTLEAMMQVVGNIGIEFADKAGINIAFLLKGLTNSELLADVKLALDYARDAVRLGGLEYVTTKDIANFDPTILAEMVEGLYDFNVMQLHAPEVMQKVVDIVNSKVSSLRIRTTSEDFESLDYVNEFAVLAQIITSFEDLMKAEVCHSLNDLIDIVKLKLYTQKGFFNETAFDVMITMLNKATELQTLEVLLPDLLHYVVKLASANRIDISFIIDKAYTTEYQLEDIRTCIRMLDKAYDFGIMDYVFDKDILEMNEVILNEILDEAIQLHILDLYFHEFIALGYNKLFKAASIDIVVSKYEFADVVLADEIHTLQGIVLEIKALMDVKDYHSLSDLTKVITRKDYKYEAFYDEATGEVLANILSKAVDLESIVVVLPYLLDFVVEKVNDVDLTFLKGNFTKEELASDIKQLANAIVPAIRAELVGLLFGKKVEELNLHIAEYAEIVDAIKELSFLNKKYPELASALINKGLNAIQSEQAVTKKLFEGITFADEAPALIEALKQFELVANQAKFVTVQDIIDVTKDKKFYENEAYVNENVVYPLIDTLEELTNLQTLEAMMQVVGNIGIEFADKAGINIAFLLKGLTNSELLADVKLALDYARDAVRLGGLEYVTTKDIANFDPTILAEMVEGLYDFNVLHGNMIDILDIIFTFVNTKVKGIYFDIDYRQLKDIDYNTEFAVIASAIAEFKPFMEGLEYTSLSSLMNIFKNKDYVYENFYNETSYKALTRAINTMADSQILGAMLPDLLDYAIQFAYEKGYDIIFLKDEVYTTEFKLEDIRTIANILDKAYDFGIVEYVFNKNIEEINDIILNEILEEVGRLHVLDLFTADLLALGINKGFELANIDITVTRDEFVDIVIADEVHALQGVVTEFKALMNEKGLKSLLDITDYIKAKNYNNIEFFDETTGGIIANILTGVTDVETIVVLLPKLLDYGLEKIKDIDLLFLKGIFTKEELRSDLRSLAMALVPAIRAGVVKVIYKQDIKQLPLEIAELQEVLTVIKDMNILNKAWPTLASKLTNYALEKMNSVQRVTEADFAYLTFAEDVPTLIEALDSLEEVLQRVNATTINDMIDIFKNKEYKDISIANKDVANAVLMSLEKAVDAHNIQALLPAMFKHVCEQLTTKGIDVDYLFAIVTNEQIVEDVYTILHTSKELVDFGIIEFVLADGEIQLDDFSALHYAIESILGLHVMNGNQPNAIITLFKQLKVETETIDLFDVNWTFETDNLQAMLEVVRQLLARFELNTISKMKAFNVNKLFTVNDGFNDLLDLYDELLTCIANDQVISKIILPVSKRYLENVNYKELISLHNIYHNASEFQSDILGLQKIVAAVRNLDLNGFLRHGADYPFRDSENIQTIISQICDLYYLNNENRLDQILNFIDSRVEMDLSEISAEGIDLRADADKFIQIYEHFVRITESKYWTMNKNGDKFDIRLLGSTYVLENMLDMTDIYMDTTVYDKTGFAILLFALPVVKFIAPNYYEALELGKVTISMLEHDQTYLEDIIQTLVDLDITNVITNGSYFTEEVHQAISSILDDLFELEIGKGHANAFFTELVNDLVNGKTIQGVEVPEGTIVFETTSFRSDRESLNVVLDELYALFASENITTISDFKTFMNNLLSTSGLKDFLSKDSSWDRMENIANAIYNMTFVGENGLSIMNNIVTPILEQKGSKLAKYVDLSDYTNELFMNDIRITKDLISSMKSLGVAGIIRDEEIAYGKVEDIQNILVGISELYYMESHMDQIIDFLSRRLPFSIDALHSTDFAFANDMLTISEAYPHLVAYLTSSNNPFKTLSDITDFVKGGFKVTKSLLISTADYLYDFADAYDLLVNVTALALVAPEFAAYVKPKLPEKFQGLANVVSVEGMSFSEVQADLKISSELLRNLIDFGIADILDNRDVTFTGMVMSTLLDKEVTRAEMINMIIENIRQLICLSDRSGFVLEVLELMQVDTTTIDFSGVDWEVEFDNLETLVVESIAVLEAHDLHTWKEIVNYINQFNVKSEMKRVVETIQATIEHIVFITETLDSSTAFNQLFKPLYNKYVFPKLPTNMYNLGNLDEYTITDLDEDMTRLAVIARALKEMKDVPGSVKDNATSDECIIPTQRIIEEFFSLNLLNQKKQEIVYFIDTLNSQIDLSTFDVTNVDLANDGKIFAQYAKEILIIYKNMIDYTFTTTDLANTELMDAVITIYNGCVDTDSIQVIANWVYSKYIAPIEEERHWVSRFDTVDETVAQIAKEFGFILEAFLEMGVFSNDGIDFTNKVATDKLFGIFENVYIFTDQRMVLIDMLKEGFEELGVIPFSYENIRMNNEIKVVRDVFRLVRDFMNKHLDDFKQNVLETLDSYAVQNEIDEIISCMFESMIVKQLALPVINGMTKIYTRDIYEITIFEGMTEDEFRNSFMSDVYDIIEKARELKVSGRYFDYTNVDSVIGLLDIIVNRTPFSSHLEELVKYVLYILDVDVRDEYFGNIDWSTEYSNFRLALQEMSDAMSGVVISDVSTMKNNTFLSALAEALPYLNNSELLPLVARQAVEMFINKIDDSGRFNYYINRLYNSAYTNELLMKDYRLLPEIIKAVVDLGYFDGGINYQQLDPVVDLLELFFEVEFVKGDEVRYFNAITKRVDLISSYDIDYTLVIDWDAEKVVLINAVKELVSLTHLIDINHLTPESFNDKVVQEQFVSTIDAMSKSIIGQQLVPQLYADKVEPNLGHSDYQGVIDFSDPEFTPDCWASEFEKFFEAYNILQKYQYGSKNMTLVNADAIELMTILFGTRENKEAGIMTIYKNPKVWLNRLYDNNVIPVPENAIVNSTSDRDWNDEPYRIIDILKQMDNFTTSEGVFTYDKVYNCQDEEQLHELLETVNNCVALRETILPIILNTMEESAEVSEALANAGLIDAEFDAVCDEWRLNGTYDADYWTVERIEAFARVIAQTNANA